MEMINTRRNRAIGIFDSGVGGLTVAKEISKQLPNENLIYFGDTARTPYGSKAKATVNRFSLECVNYLQQYNIKALVVACNTASAYAIPTLKKNINIPVIGVIEPGAKMALETLAARGRIGIIGTQATIQSEAYIRVLRKYGYSGSVISKACPLLVPLVEEGWLKGKILQAILEHYLHPMLNQGMKSLILGCTHYPALKAQIAEVCGPRVTIIDSAVSVTTRVQDLLARMDLATTNTKPGKRKYLVTDVPEKFIQVGSRILSDKNLTASRVRLPEVRKNV